MDVCVDRKAFRIFLVPDLLYAHLREPFHRPSREERQQRLVVEAPLQQKKVRHALELMVVAATSKRDLERADACLSFLAHRCIGVGSGEAFGGKEDDVEHLEGQLPAQPAPDSRLREIERLAL